MNEPALHRQALLLLSAIGAITPLAIDLYLPALPQIAALLDVPMQRIESSVSTYMVGLGAGVLIGAAVSDRFGRKPSVIAGLIVFCVCSLFIGMTHDSDLFLALRVVQALGGGFAFVNIPAIVRDLYDEQNSARAFTMIAIIALIAPLIAPTIGSIIMEISNWRTIFFALATYAAALCVLVAAYLPETSRRRGVPPDASIATQIRSNVRRVMGNPEAVALVVCQGFVFAVMFAFVADASFAYMIHYGLSSWHFSILFGANIATLMLFNRLNKRLLLTRRPFEIVPFGIGIQIGSSALLLLAVLAGVATLWVFVPLIMLGVGAHALVTPNLVATFMGRFEEGAGTASGVITCAQYLGAGLVSLLAAALHDGTLLTTALTMFLSAVCAVAAYRVARARRNARLALEAAAATG